MKRRTFTGLLLSLAIGAPHMAGAQSKLMVVATTPDLGALAREIGGHAVEVRVLAKPTEDPHFVDARPSHIVTLNRADVLVEGGAELELGWLPPLVESARNARIAAGGRGRIVASQGVRMLEVPTTFDRAKGDVHALGNPHFLLDPLNTKLVIVQIAERFAQLAPASAATFAANRKEMESRIDAKLTDWQNALAPFTGARIITFHKDFAYLAARFGLEIAETLEPKPGIAPSPAHLARVIETIRSHKIRVILVQPFQNRKTAETVARQAGAAKVLLIPQQPGAITGTETYVGLMDAIVGSLAAALGAAK